MRRHIGWRVRGKVMTKSWSRYHDAYLCTYCVNRLTERDVVIDHIVPLSLGGTDEMDNLQVTCRRCNLWKADKTPEDAEEYIFERLDRLWEEEGRI